MQLFNNSVQKDRMRVGEKTSRVYIYIVVITVLVPLISGSFVV